MNWMDKLERKWGRHAVANLSRYFVLAQVIGYVVQLTAPGLMSYMNFDMGSILHGQIWRIVTWIFTPTASLDVFGILFLFCVLMWGSSLESMLGTFRMNVFLWGSVILCDIVGAIVYVVTRILLGYGFSPYLSTYYILMSMKTRLSGKQKKRQKEFRAQFSQPRPGSGIARHKCAICGRTELTNPELQFRYCSKCVGNREYCQDHLFTHQHVK